ncbi:MAG: 23S rRNA (adenine(2503)-C(2))-methyltransferase RlmN [Planctomycetes bacterium]|nr:23S rRNA (adenine(2503)-C(2))-methyltransferase RlmN [Planctomycetota bacterium]
MDRPHLRDIPVTRLAAELESRGFEKAAPRAHQLGIAIHRDGARSFDELPRLEFGREFRRKLEESFELTPRIVESQIRRASDAHTTKWLVRLAGGDAVEFVMIKHWDDHTLCVSSQAGCAMGCTFCATGTMGLRRNLAAGEITEAIVHAERETGKRITDVVFMGMGEPLHNYDSVMTACVNMNERGGHGISRRRITISTVGLPHAIRRMTSERRIWRMHVSLHSAVQETRERIIPVAKLYQLPDLLDAVREHQAAMKVKWVTLQYVALPGVNMDEAHVEALGRELNGIKYILNVIPWNDTGTGGFRAPTWDEVRAFTGRLRSLNCPVKVRYSAGKREGMGCGQLAAETRSVVPSGHMIAPPGIFSA